MKKVKEKTEGTKQYNPNDIEPKWQQYWVKNKTFSPDVEKAKKPFFNLMMFPYPSAEGMHVGNMYAFTGADVYGRYQRMKGNDVLEPIGLDGFGIHSENYALKIGAHPMDQADKSEKNFYRQMHATGNSYDWDRTVETYKPNYYTWTQWLFVEMFKAGLAYRKKAQVNWCPSCKTVLADEQVIAGECERCGSVVEKRDLEQWFFKITDYAERLLENIEDLDWSQKVKIAQTEWIGKSQGVIELWDVEGLDFKLETFTTWPHTTFGATFLAIAPEHPVIEKLLAGSDKKKEAEKFIAEVKQDKIDNPKSTEKEKKGFFTGRYALNFLTGAKMPIYIANFALMEYGTGIVKGAPAHDQRDFEFAKKYNLDIVVVINPKDRKLKAEELTEAYTEPGVMASNTKEFAGLKDTEGKKAVADFTIKLGHGRAETYFHLRDWLISRQRYWGAPIPMIYCANCAKAHKSYFTEYNKQNKTASDSTFWDSEGWYPEENLPVLLPRIKDYKPLGTGKAPLETHPDFYKVTCPVCGGEAKRETDVSDTFLDSAWYFLRYPSTDIDSKAFDIDRTKKWLPVNMYIGGAEHSVLHLLYSRFTTMFLHDKGYIDFEEPYKRFFAHGLIIKEGSKMSKSKGNVVIPDEYIAKYGADALRMYLMFLGPFSQGGDFRDSGMEGMYKFVKRVWNFLQAIGDEKLTNPERLKWMHKTIKRVTHDLDQLHYNTAIAGLMEWYNFLSQHVLTSKQEVSRQEAEVLLKLLAPFAPHITEELWKISYSQKGEDYQSIHKQLLPEFDKKYIEETEVTVVVQVNGKLRQQLTLSTEQAQNQKEVEKIALSDLKVKQYLEGKEIKKVIFVPSRIINFVI